MSANANSQPLFSDGQLTQLRGVVREEIQQTVPPIVREIVHEIVDGPFAAIQQDLTKLNEGQEQLPVAVQEEKTERQALDERVQRQLDTHTEQLEALGK